MKAGVVWSVFGLGVVLAAGVLAWVSVALTDLERAHADANRRALADQNVRAALWRLESELTPLVTDEAARPYFHYLSFYPADGAYASMFGDARPDSPLVPSPLLFEPPAPVLLHFQLEPDGSATSPQVPRFEHVRIRMPDFVSGEQAQLAQRRLRELLAGLTRETLAEQLPAPRDASGISGFDAVYANDRWASLGSNQLPGYGERQEATQNAANIKHSQARIPFGTGAAHGVKQGPMTAWWHGGTLLLARRIGIGGREYIQGCVLDWPAIRQRLQEASRDLLPHAIFRAAPIDPTEVEGPDVQRLASLPIEIVPGEVAADAPSGNSPLRLTLILAWACLLAFASGMGFVLARMMSLSARREEFVSAVTHELRTPLTTFRMYTEMLQSGRVTDETSRGEYYTTLHNEALRLGHLVENVLAYARLERTRNDDRLEALPAGKLLQRCHERLSQRARQAGMQLDVAPCPEVIVRADPGAVEQILFNLVDNACKYAASGKRIEIKCEQDARAARLIVRDHGPGIAAYEAANLFKPFRKSAQRAANSAPGVGLGLALSRRLARAMGGELSLESGKDGGCRFLLTLPLE